ncbi:hypothetical protein CHS0354_029383 [Potamilus streckersoni]|uniref:Uncharacterized protein n=1 Tax=Potamilus streckersoni TaxID=2493646 RepID=A0AAE0STU5_9BIVA|nr:hypothetical protein CHS0354_029383 [Potamilus streckersoni]
MSESDTDLLTEAKTLLSKTFLSNKSIIKIFFISCFVKEAFASERSYVLANSSNSSFFRLSNCS